MESIFRVAVDLMLPMYSSTFLQAIESLQKQQTPPFSEGVYYLQILQSLKKTTLIGHLNQAVFDPLFIAYFKLDLFYATPDMTKFSVQKLDESYTTFTEGIKQRYVGYAIDKNNQIVTVQDREIDFDELRHLLLSKDMEKYAELKTDFFGPTSRFLTGKKSINYTYTSFPRSGNTFLRKQMENILGLATGSDMVMLFQLNVSLQYAGFKGEGINDNRVLINKSHFPARFPYDSSYDTNAVLVCVRNPLDVLVSSLNFLVTLTHNKQISQDYTQMFPEIWETCIREDIQMWKMWHWYWIEKAEKQEMPIFFVRYEDVLKEPRKNLEDIFKFLFAQESIEGTVLQRRISEMTSQGQEQNIIYTPRVGSYNKNLEKYSPAQLDYIKSELEELLYYMGYVTFPGNHLGFFDFQGKARASSLEKFQRFRVLNERAMQMVKGKGFTPEEFVQKINGGGDGFKWIKEKKSIFDLAYIQNVATIK